jgi:hypothetical protein
VKHLRKNRFVGLKKLVWGRGLGRFDRRKEAFILVIRKDYIILRLLLDSRLSLDTGGTAGWAAARSSMWRAVVITTIGAAIGTAKGQRRRGRVRIMVGTIRAVRVTVCVGWREHWLRWGRWAPWAVWRQMRSDILPDSLNNVISYTFC